MRHALSHSFDPQLFASPFLMVSLHRTLPQPFRSEPFHSAPPIAALPSLQTFENSGTSDSLLLFSTPLFFWISMQAKITSRPRFTRRCCSVPFAGGQRNCYAFIPMSEKIGLANFANLPSVQLRLRQKIRSEG